MTRFIRGLFIVLLGLFLESNALTNCCDIGSSIYHKIYSLTTICNHIFEKTNISYIHIHIEMQKFRNSNN